MSTIIRGQQVAYTITGLPQSYTISEGTLSLPISPIGVTSTGENYGNNFHAQFDITGTQQVSSINLLCNTLQKLSFPRTNYTDSGGIPAAYYSLDSRYVSIGTQLNNWAYFKLALQGLSIQFTNSDVSQSFVVRVRIWAGPNTDFTTNPLITDQNINVTIAAIPDVTGENQTKTGLPMMFSSRTLTSMGGQPVQIADLQQAQKTYRVTFSVNDVINASGTSHGLLWLWDTANGVDQGFLKSVSLTGTQGYLNGVLAGNIAGSLGLFFASYNPDFFGTFTVSYKQEVITSQEVGVIVPYVQETGLLTFGIDYTAPFVMATPPSYTEDVTTPAFNLGTLTDQAGQQWAHETCGQFAQHNCYLFDIQVLGTFTPQNPVVITVAGDATPNDNFQVQGNYAYHTDLGSPIHNLIIIPPADYSDPITLRVRLLRGNGDSPQPFKQIYEQNMVVPCISTHPEFVLNAAHVFALGSNILNFGSITDTAINKSYTSTLDFINSMPASLSSGGSGGTSNWNPTGGSGGFGRLTLTGNKTQINSHLSTINFTTLGGATTSQFVNINYTQTQDTNSLNQGSQEIFIGNAIQWGNGNGIHDGQNAFVYDQDVSMTWNLAILGPQLDSTTNYTAKIIFSTPLSTTNLGSVTGWTRETDLIWTKTGVKADLNTALSAVIFNPPAQLISDFDLDIAVFNGATQLFSTATFGSSKTVYLRTPVSITWTSSPVVYNQDIASTFTNLAVLNANFNATSTYTLRLITSIDTGGIITGWTKINATTFEKIDTKANLQAALNSVVFTPPLTFVSSFDFNIQASRSSLLIYNSSTIPNGKTINLGAVYSIAFTGSTTSFNQDTTTTFNNFATLSINFSPSKTYTIELITSIQNIGSFTGWTQQDATTHSRTGTGASLQTALNSLEFIPQSSLVTSFNINFKAYLSSTLVYDGVAASNNKLINIGVILNITWGTATFSYSENTKKTFATFAVLNSIFDPTRTYKIEIISSTPLSVANGGSITGWTRQTDTIWEKTDTAPNLQTALNSVELVPSADYRTPITFTIRAYRNAILLNTSIDRNVSVAGTNIDKNTIVSSFQLVKNQNTTTTNIGSITDNRPDNINSAIQYLVTLTPTFFPNLSMSSAGVGGSSSWDGRKLTLTGTKAQVTSHLASITFNYTNIETTIVTVVQTQTTNNVGQGTKTFTLLKPFSDTLLTGNSTNAWYSSTNTTWVNIPSTKALTIYPGSFKTNKWVIPESQGATDKFLRASVFNGSSWSSLVVDSTPDYAVTGGENQASTQTFGDYHYILVLMPAKKLRVFRSLDTIAWSMVYEHIDIAAGYTAFSAWTFSSSGGRLFIVTAIASGGDIVRLTTHSSSDGANWFARNDLPGTNNDTTAISQNFEPIYNYNRQVWMMSGELSRVDGGITTQKLNIYESSDGINWVTAFSIDGQTPYGKIATNNNNTFVIPIFPIPNASTLGNNIVSTNSGVTWAKVPAWPSPVRGGAVQSNSYIVFGNGIFVGRVQDQIYTSSNGTNWTLRFSITPTGDSTFAGTFDLRFINDIFYLTAFQNPGPNYTIYSSTNGISWTLLQTGPGTVFTYG